MGRVATGTVEFRGTPARWFARVTVATDIKRADGKAKTRRVWVDLERPDLKDTPADKATAKRLAAQRARMARKGTFVGVAKGPATASAPLSTFEDRWSELLDRNPDLEDGSRERYKSCFRSAVRTLGDRPVQDVTPVVLKTWLWQQRKTLAAATVRGTSMALARFFDDGMAEGWFVLASNPFRDRMVRGALPDTKQSGQTSDDIVRHTQEQLEQLLASPTLPDHRFGLYLVDILGGYRDGELRGLQFGRLTKRDGIACAHVLYQLDQKLELRAPKYKSARWVPLHPLASTWLEWWRAEGWQAYTGRAPTDDDFVFPNREGEPARPQSAKALQLDHVDAGVSRTFTLSDGTTEPYVMHTFRHDFASLLSDADVHGEVVDVLLGHKSASTRNRHYRGMALATLASAVEKLSLALPNRPGVGSTGPVQSSLESSRATATARAKQAKASASRTPTKVAAEADNRCSAFTTR